jgi:hypothetical protein
MESKFDLKIFNFNVMLKSGVAVQSWQNREVFCH